MSITMDTIAEKAVVSTGLSVLLGVADRTVAQNLAREIVCRERTSPISVAPTLTQLRDMSKRIGPAVILLDEELVGQKSLGESLRHFTATTPVVLLGSIERHGEVARLVAEGHLEFVARTGDFAMLAASLVQRRLRWMKASESALRPPCAESPMDIGEVFRHEINNPLTGILGNAELLLAHRDNLSAMETQRLQTVVDLAVRLRETIRRVSNALERQPHTMKSA